MRTWDCAACRSVVSGDEVDWREASELDTEPPSPRCPTCGEPLKLRAVGCEALIELVRRN